MSNVIPTPPQEYRTVSQTVANRRHMRPSVTLWNNTYTTLAQTSPAARDASDTTSTVID